MILLVIVFQLFLIILIGGFDCENKPCKLIENTITTEQYNTKNELEANSLCELVNEKEERIKKLSEENEQLKEENEKLKEIFMKQLENALTLSFVKEVYCNALLRILDENDSIEESKKFIKDYLYGDD